MEIPFPRDKFELIYLDLVVSSEFMIFKEFGTFYFDCNQIKIVKSTSTFSLLG